MFDGMQHNYLLQLTHLPHILGLCFVEEGFPLLDPDNLHFIFNCHI